MNLWWEEIRLATTNCSLKIYGLETFIIKNLDMKKTSKYILQLMMCP